MSYYFKSKFSLTNHGFIRIKQRIKKCQNMSFNEVITYVNNLLDNVTYEFSDHQYKYYRYPLSDLYSYYFYVEKNNNLIVTFSPMSNHTKLGKI